MYLGSDALALAPFTDDVTYLEDGDWVVLSRTGADIRDAEGRPAARARQKVPAGTAIAERGNYRHFMAKEIAEQPEVVGRTLAHYVQFATGRVELPFRAPFDFDALDRIAISACGTAYYAGLIGKYWFERLARLAGRDRRRFRVPLPRGAPRARRPRPVRLAVGRDRGHARLAALCQAGGAARRCRSSTCRRRRSHARARPWRRRSPAPRSASPRPRRSPASSPCCSASRSRPDARAAPCPRPTSDGSPRR